MTVPIAIASCPSCRHLHRADRTGNFCDAFPDGVGIPRPILLAEHDHKTPFPGDHGIRFEPIDTTAQED